MRRLYDLVGLTLMSCFLGAVWLDGHLPTWLHPLWMSATLSVLMVAGCVTLLCAVRRLRRRAEAVGWLLCPDCVYPLAGEEGACPECGRPFRQRELRDEWLAW